MLKQGNCENNTEVIALSAWAAGHSQLRGVPFPPRRLDVGAGDESYPRCDMLGYEF